MSIKIKNEHSTAELTNDLIYSSCKIVKKINEPLVRLAYGLKRSRSTIS